MHFLTTYLPFLDKLPKSAMILIVRSTAGQPGTFGPKFRPGPIDMGGGEEDEEGIDRKGTCPGGGFVGASQKGYN